MTPRRVVIVGGGLAGSRCAQTLRAEGFDGAITLIGEELEPPYERPALSKEFLAGKRGDLALQPAGYWEANEIQLLPGTRVERIDPKRQSVRSADTEIRWDTLVLATGARARRLAGIDGPGVHVLRTLADAKRLRGELAPGRRLVILGAGFVGTEVASTALRLGVEVVLLDTGRLPFEGTLGPDVGRFLAARYQAHGVDLRLETRAAGLRRDAGGLLRAVVLADGSEVACDLVLVAAGAEPAAELVRAPTGIQTDESGRTALPGVYACGDVAAPWHPPLAAHRRLEHWTSAAQQAANVARAILGLEPHGAASAYFWSDQFDLRLQHVGGSVEWARVAVEEDEGSLEARYLAADDRLVAALVVNRPHAVAQLRRHLASEPIAA
jgi:3-phenylpropionate/trans-cinnamate dioxygenase ferredoxin reductase subunit